MPTLEELLEAARLLNSKAIPKEGRMYLDPETGEAVRIPDPRPPLRVLREIAGFVSARTARRLRRKHR